MALTPHEPEPIAQIAAWQEELTALQDRIAPRFARPEVRARAGKIPGRLAGSARAAQRLAAGRGAGGAQPGWGAAVAAHRPLGCRGGAR